MEAKKADSDSTANAARPHASRIPFADDSDRSLSAANAPTPVVSLTRIRTADSRPVHALDRASRWALLTTCVILAFGFLFVASDLLVPITIATLAYLSLRPMAAKLRSWGISNLLASIVVIATIFSSLGMAVSVLYSPTQQWLESAPESVSKIRARISNIAAPITALDRADETVQRATEPIEGDAERVAVTVEKPSVVSDSKLINQTGKAAAFLVAIGVLTFFMLSTGDDLLNRMMGLLHDWDTRDALLEKISDIQHGVGKYLAQITTINICLGVAVGCVMWLVDMPTPILWGALAALFNFIPYVGPLAATVLVFLAATSHFNALGRAALTAVAFWLTTAVEGQFVTPAVLGKTLKVGPVVVLVAVAFWGFLWGLAGIFLACPLLIVKRKVFASFEATYTLAVVLGEEPCEPGEDCEPIEKDRPIAEAT